MLCFLHVRSSSLSVYLFEVVFLLSCLLVSLPFSAFEVVFLSCEVFYLCLWGCLPCLWSFFPLRTSSCEVVFMLYHLPMATASLDKTVFVFPIVCGGGGRWYSGSACQRGWQKLFDFAESFWGSSFLWEFLLKVLNTMIISARKHDMS